MSTKDNEKSSLLAPVIGAYEPTDADAERIFSKIEAALDAGPSSQAPASASTLSTKSRTLLAASLSCAVIAVVAGVTLRTAGDASNPSPPPPGKSAGVVRIETTAPGAVNAEPRAIGEHATGEPPMPSVDVDMLPTLSAAPATSQTSRKLAATAPSSLHAPAPAADTLDKEARLLADARRASQGGAGDRALALLDEHASAFPKGWLEGEREAERVLVLCRLGRRAEARRAAAVFLEGRPKGPLTRRVEMSCAGESDEKATE